MSSTAGSTVGRALRLAAALALAGGSAAAGALGAQQVAPQGGAPQAGDSAARRDSAAAQSLTPLADQARGVDAELRAALYELQNAQYVPALSRLEWLNSSKLTYTGAGEPGAPRGREDASFLLAEAYFRLGMDEAFRKTAEPLIWTSVGGKYAPLLRSQLLVEAYRRGDYATAKKLAEAIGQEAAAPAAARQAGLSALVSGLTAYQTGRWADARADFAKAQAAGAPYAPYAQYMDALAQLRADTTQRATVAQTFETIAAGATGELADQIRLTAAELAYQGRDYARAVTLAQSVPPTSGLAAQALLTRAWALYKSGQVAPAGDAFAEFAQRYPDLPERDEARLMSAQALLQLGRTEEAGRTFRTVADSAAAEARALAGGTRPAMSQAARALVAARAAGLLFLNEPAGGKTVALDEHAGGGDSVLAAVVQGDQAPGLAGVSAVSEPDIITTDDVRARLDSLGAPLGAGFPRRVLFTPVSAGANRGEYTARAQALFEADVQVALARYRLQEQLDAQNRQLVLLRALQQQLAEGSSQFGPFAAQLAAARDSLARLAVTLDASGARIRGMIEQQVSATRAAAAENQASIDSVRRSLGASVTPEDAEILRLESQTAAAYAQLAQEIQSGIGGAIARHPVFALRDSVRARGERIGRLLGETQTALANAQAMVAQEIARLEAGDAERVGAARRTLAAAETRRAAAEGQVVALVERELTARAGQTLASLRRDGEAAEFGSASAAFFQAIDDGRTAGTRGAAGGSATVGSDAGRDDVQTTEAGRRAGTAAPADSTPGAPSSSTPPRK